MIIMEKIFRSDIMFYIFLGCIYISSFFLITNLATTIQEFRKNQTMFKGQLENKREDMKTLQSEVTNIEETIRNKTYYRWHSYDMEAFCVLTERENDGWKCPPIDSIVDYDPDSDENLLDLDKKKDTK